MMGLGTPPITNFTAGEWSPKLYGRVDIARYMQACIELSGMIILPHGAATRRMGTEFVGMGLSAQVRLIDFVFNVEQAYCCEFTPGRIRFYRAGAYIPGADLDSPYTAEDVAALAYCQSADVMYLVCPSHAPHKLTRPGADTFALAEATFTGKPSEWTAGNYPGAVMFHQQRLWFAGTPKQPQKVWGSKTGNFETLTTGTGDSDGLSYSLVSEQVNATRWMTGRKRDLLLGTSGGEWVLTGGGAALTATNAQAERNSNYGSAPLRPLSAGASTLYVSADRRRLRDLAYNYNEDALVSSDISLLAEHLTRPGIRDVAYAQDPDGVIWCVLRDGTMAGLTYLREQEVCGWHRHETQGKVLSITALPAEGYTEIWLAVERANGVCIERMMPAFDGETSNEAGCWFLDSALLYEGAPVETLSGLEHLEGCEVGILADGAAHAARVVENGRISLEAPASRVLVGLSYGWRLTPMRLEGLSERGTMQGKQTRITDITVRLYKSMGVMYSYAGGKVYPLPCRDATMPMDAAPALFSGDARMPLEGGWGPEAYVTLSGTGPFPATVTMMVPRAAVNE